MLIVIIDSERTIMFLTKKNGPLTHKPKTVVKNRPLGGTSFDIKVGKTTKKPLNRSVISQFLILHLTFSM